MAFDVIAVELVDYATFALELFAQPVGVKDAKEEHVAVQAVWYENPSRWIGNAITDELVFLEVVCHLQHTVAQVPLHGSVVECCSEEHHSNSSLSLDDWKIRDKAIGGVAASD